MVVVVVVVVEVVVVVVVVVEVDELVKFVPFDEIKEELIGGVEVDETADVDGGDDDDDGDVVVCHSLQSMSNKLFDL